MSWFLEWLLGTPRRVYKLTMLEPTRTVTPPFDTFDEADAAGKYIGGPYVIEAMRPRQVG